MRRRKCNLGRVKEKMEITVGLIRHGVTDWNQDKRLQGQSDVPLNQLGVEQTNRLARNLLGQSWEVIYSSPLIRALKTARIIAEVLEIPVLESAGLSERKFGLLEGLSRSTIDQLFPRPWDEAALGIEPLSDLVGRALDTLQTIVTCGCRSILVVSHGAWINAVLNTVSHGEYGTGKTDLANGSISFLKLVCGRWQVVSVNQTQHLQIITGQTQ
jgi:broad specificity phosphatase PhoE